MSGSEIKDIMDLLGRGIVEGSVRGSHLGQILMYLHKNQTEKLKATLSKLALICGMQKRYVRENYIEGLVEFGIIKTTVLHNEVVWKWIGIKAFEKNNTTFMQYVREKEEKEEQEKQKKKKKGKDK